MIHEANTDAARHEVLDFFLAAFDDIDPNAVPTTVHDDLYARSWCNSAMRTAGGCWVPSSPAAHRSLPVRRDEEAWRVITAGAHAASTANTRQSERLYVGPSLQLRWAAAEHKARVVLRGYVRYTNQTGTPLLVRLGDRRRYVHPETSRRISAPQTHFHAGHHGRHPDQLDTHQDQK